MKTYDSSMWFLSDALIVYGYKKFVSLIFHLKKVDSYEICCP